MNTTVRLIVLLTLLSVTVVNAYTESNGKLLDWLFADDDDEPDIEIPEATSGSRTELKGWFKIIVIGTGKACFRKQFSQQFSRVQQFGEWTTSEAFIEFFGEPECEPGRSLGLAWGKVRASVVAAAYEKGGRQCVSRVVASVITDPLHLFSIGDVRVRISGESVGEAEALCEAPAEWFV